LKIGRPVLTAALLLYAGLLTAGAQPSEQTTGKNEASEPETSIIVIILDNSASLPPLDPQQKRQTALEKMLGFLEGQPHRLILFGGREEISSDSPARYNNRGQWTDFYFAFKKAREVIESYPEGSDIKMVLITDGVADPSPADWEDQHVPEGADLKSYVGFKTLEFLGQMRTPLYVMEIGTEVSSDFIEEMVQVANGPLAGNRYAQRVSEFLQDDGVVLRRFIYRIEPGTGLENIEPIVRRIAAPPSYRTELIIAATLLFLTGVLVSVGVRSFPGTGDQEVVELRAGQPVHLVVDQMRPEAIASTDTSWLGLSLVESATQAAASLNLIGVNESIPPDGFDLKNLSRVSKELIRSTLPELRSRLEELTTQGDKEEKLEALNYEYAGSGFEASRAEQLLGSSVKERRRIDPKEFLHAKIHLLYNPLLYNQFTVPTVRCNIYGTKARKRELRAGSSVNLGRYTFRVDALAQGGRKDYVLHLAYERVPSILWLKNLMPAFIQKLIRFRRRRKRVVV
jgi:hypothetical protein